jgi:pyroglutamyl-peptidase
MLVRILITGFEPFLDEKVNPTLKIVEFVNRSKFQGLDVRGLVLPVEFDGAFQRLEKEREVFQPAVVICFGLAGGRTTFDVEALAVNERGGDQSSRGDNRGRVLSGPIRVGAPLSFPSTLPVDRILSFLAEAHVPCRKSHSAGTYVCNDLFFQLQDRLRYTRVKSGFIHVPRLENNWPIFELAVVAVIKAISLKLPQLNVH